MFGLAKPAHLQMRAALPAHVVADFDAFLAKAEAAHPTRCEKGAHERGVAIIMGGWIDDRVTDGDFGLSPVMREKVRYLVDLASRYNDSDVHGDGWRASGQAREVLRGLRYAARQEAREERQRQPDMDDLARRKRELDEKLGRVGKG